MAHLKMQIEDKEKERFDEKAKYPTKVQQCMNDDQEIKEWKDKMKQGKLQWQQDYAKVLEGQLLEKKNKEINVRIGKERRVDDARNKIENSPTGMVPGIYNLASIGSRPIYRTGVIISNSSPIGLSAKYTKEIDISQKERKYNTITNQVPYVTSNPYILRELKKYSIK